MYSTITIHAPDPMLEHRLLEYLMRPDIQRMLEGARSREIIMHPIRPLFPSPEQEAYLRSIGCDLPRPDNYRIYIGNDIKELTERLGGVEIPGVMLDDFEMFKVEIISRIKACWQPH